MVVGLESLTNRTYPGRFIAVGMNSVGVASVVYGITGRSESSQARRLALREESGYARSIEVEVSGVELISLNSNSLKSISSGLFHLQVQTPEGRKGSYVSGSVRMSDLRLEPEFTAENLVGQRVRYEMKICNEPASASDGYFYDMVFKVISGPLTGKECKNPSSYSGFSQPTFDALIEKGLVYKL